MVLIIPYSLIFKQTVFFLIDEVPEVVRLLARMCLSRDPLQVCYLI